MMILGQQPFWQLYSEATLTTLGFFWKALWAFVLGYLVSSAIQVFVTEKRMQQIMGKAGSGSVAIATFFGFISSSCSFAALATTKALFQKGAGFIPALAFMLASTNLVIELGIIIAIFLSWQFVVGEYVGGILLILLMWGLVHLTRPKKLLNQVKKDLRQSNSAAANQEKQTSWQQKIQSLQGWRQVAQKYFMEWGMVWKDVTIGFTIAGIIAAFVPRTFFETLFLTQQGSQPGFWIILENTLVGPVAAFLTFIGSMGNIPLAAILYNNGVSFAGIMAFIFSDLVVFPIIRINAKYYGWKLALYILAILLGALVLTSLILHYGFLGLGLLPESSGSSQASSDRFAIDYTFFLNLFFLALSGVLAWLKFGHQASTQSPSHSHHHSHNHSRDGLETVLLVLAWIAYGWLAVGLVVTGILHWG